MPEISDANTATHERHHKCHGPVVHWTPEEREGQCDWGKKEDETQIVTSAAKGSAYPPFSFNFPSQRMEHDLNSRMRCVLASRPHASQELHLMSYGHCNHRKRFSTSPARREMQPKL